MPDLFIFLLKVNAALLLFCAGYYLVLRHLTFYTLNRIYLLTAILFATVYPKINLSAFVERHKQIAKPVEGIMLRWQAPAKALINQRPDYWLWVEVVFWAGVILLAARLMVQLYSLFKLYRNSTAAQIYNHNVRIMNTDSGPFSFWKSIYINPANHEPSDLRSILQHEQIHVSEWHTLDVLLAELSTIFYWFNPGVWLMKKAVKENIEFITDRKVLRNGADTKQYQYSLVNVSLSAAPQGIVNHFNISTIKKRIIMMNAKRSSKVKLTRYAFLVPAVVAMLLVFSISKAALVKKSIRNIKTSSLSLLITKSINPVMIIKAKIIPNAGVIAKKNRIQQNLTVKVTDTIRKGKFFLSSNNGLDSSNIVINGVKSSKTDLDNLNPNDIDAINMVSTGIANDIVAKLDKSHGTIFVTTRGSEAGAKFKEKLDKITNNVHGISGTGHSSSNLNSVIVVGRSSNNAGGDSDYDGPMKVESFNIAKSGASSPATTLTLHSNNVNGSGVIIYNSKINKDTSVKGYSLLVDTFKRLKYNTKLYKANGNSSGRTYSNFQTSYSYSNSPNHFSVDHIADKMIIINGKISTTADLKKISAFDIDKMVLKTDLETKELYGDKAKNGIVFIVTKK
ncbi:MAG: M56 family metallopeptidase [Bacteroidota bacterium]|nr:M56 family metallopeptidase [Bacteroidota bacterium]